jgi:DNA-binding NtrC family response regulator
VVVQVQNARAKPSRVALSAGSIVIGAGPTADVILDDPRVSRTHVQVQLVPEGVEVTDLESRNGTFYLGNRVHRLVLPPGSRIEVGSATILFEPDTSQLDAAGASRSAYRGLMGRSSPMVRLFSKLTRLEGSLVNVLIQGESGVGKELIAHALHQGSALCDAPMVIVNCAALRGDLVRSELFGHKKGAFTGAIESRVGALEQAHGGTLFLDEIGELPLEVQPLLLRALETGDVPRVGETQPRQVKVRVLAASHRDLLEMCKRGDFREDLYYRLAVVTLQVPPLRGRVEDIPLLANHFARHAGVPELPPEFVDELKRREWRGNARELKNAVHAFLALGSLDDGAPPSDDALEGVFRRFVDLDKPFQDQKQHVADVFGKLYFQMLLERCGGNRSEAARQAAMDRSYFGKQLSRYGADPAGGSDGD